MLPLYKLVFYCSKGFHDIECSPLIEPPWSEDLVVMHLCEKKPTGSCCCPWHMAFGNHSLNASRGVAARKYRGHRKEQPLAMGVVKRGLGKAVPGPRKVKK